MKDKLNTVKTVLCAVFAAGCAVLGFFFWDASDRAGSLLEENDALREQLSVTQSDAKNAAAAASELQKQVDEMTAQIDELNSRLEQAAQSGADAGAAGPMVYVTPSGSRYHNEGCQYIGKRAVQMPLADAKEAGYNRLREMRIIEMTRLVPHPTPAKTLFRRMKSKTAKTEHRNIHSRNKRKSPANKVVCGTFHLVRVTGFEPAASSSQSRRATNCATPGYIGI